MVAENIFNRKSRTGDKRWFCCLGVGWWATKSSPLRRNMFRNGKESLGSGQMLRNRPSTSYLKRHMTDMCYHKTGRRYGAYISIYVPYCVVIYYAQTSIFCETQLNVCFSFLTIMLSRIAQFKKKKKLHLQRFRSVHLFVRSLYKIFCTFKFRK
jgi:hypothetical protein